MQEIDKYPDKPHIYVSCLIVNEKNEILCQFNKNN